MHPVLVATLWLTIAARQPREVTLTIIRDPYTSSDQVTLCRVRAVNHGGRSWQGRELLFEARAGEGSGAVRKRGRFGLILEPYASLETLVALPGRHDRFAVAWVSSGDEASPKLRKKSGGRKHRPRRR